MRGKLIGYGTLTAVLLWLTLSYVPISLPQLAFPVAAAGGLRWLVALVLGLFVALQLLIVARTPAILRASRQQARPISRSLSPASELFWTLLPLAATVVVIGALIGVRIAH